MLKMKCFLVFLILFINLKADESLAPAPTEPSAIELNTPTVPTEASTISYEGAFMRMILTLAGLIILIFLTIWVLRRLSQGRVGGNFSSRTIKVLERRALSHKSVLYVVEISRKKVVIVESQLEVRTITTLDEEPES